MNHRHEKSFGMNSAELCVLVVDPSDELMDSVSEHLVRDGFLVRRAGDGEEALATFRAAVPDLLLLELDIARISGLDLFREIRRTSDVPTIIVTNRSAEADRVVGLELGADDYIVKPYSKRELLARVGAVMRRSRCECGLLRSSHPRDMQNAITIDRERHNAKRGNQIIQLTATEFRILDALASNVDQTLTRSQLLDIVGHDSYIYDRTLDKHVANLRRKIEVNPSHPNHVITIFGVGYRFRA